MARTALTVQVIPRHGKAIDELTFTAADATNDHEFVNDGQTLLLVKNQHSSAQAVTIVSVADPFGREEDTTMSVDAGNVDPKVGIAGPFSPSLFNQAGGLVHVDITDDTALEFAAVKFFAST